MDHLSKLVGRRALLQSTLAKAQSIRDAALNARQQFLISGDVDDVKATAAHQGHVQSAESSLTGISSALEALSASITAAEAAVASETLVTARKTASEKLADDLRIVEAKIIPFLKLAQEVGLAYQKLGPVSWEAGAVGRYILETATQIELGGAAALSDVATSVRAIAAGDMPMPKAAEPEVPVGLPETPTEQIAPAEATYPRQRVTHSAHDTFTPLPRGPGYTVTVGKA